jgi:hypothetical protein
MRIPIRSLRASIGLDHVEPARLISTIVDWVIQSQVNERKAKKKIKRAWEGEKTLRQTDCGCQTAHRLLACFAAQPHASLGLKKGY